MVNEDKDKFRQVQNEHLGKYIGGSNKEKPGRLNRDDYNTQENTDKSVGATGRDL